MVLGSGMDHPCQHGKRLQGGDRDADPRDISAQTFRRDPAYFGIRLEAAATGPEKIGTG
jgi:hypothetical protein